MSLVSVRDIKNLLKRYKVHPLRRLGQNFLIDEGVIKKVIESARLSKNDIILEIGPGIGVLTMELAKKVKKVIAIEKDPKMIEILKETSGGFKNVEIIPGDVLKIFNSKFSISNYKIVSNLPFYLTALAIRQFLEAVEVKPQQMVLVVQKEVGQRICANPPEMSILAVSVQFYAKAEIETFVSKKSFWPQPKVDGAIIKIIPKKILFKPNFSNLFFKIAKAGFSQPRKQLINNLSKELKLNREKVNDWLSKNNVQPTQRAETLTVENWISLTRAAAKGEEEDLSSSPTQIAMKGEEEIHLFDYEKF